MTYIFLTVCAKEEKKEKKNQLIHVNKFLSGFTTLLLW